VPPAGPAAPLITNVAAWLEAGCQARELSGSQLYAQQDLFSIWVHRSPGAHEAPPSSIFHGRDITDRCAQQLLRWSNGFDMAAGMAKACCLGHAHVERHVYTRRCMPHQYTDASCCHHRP
jgi:hypothetical protein